jgi:hypothetical protein
MDLQGLVATLIVASQSSRLQGIEKWRLTWRSCVQDALMIGLFSFVTSMMVLGWIASVLKDATDTVYVCFARDMEHRRISRQEVHTVYKELPAASGVIVVQPDDAVLYGAMEEGVQPVHAAVSASPSAPHATMTDTVSEATPLLDRGK